MLPKLLAAALLAAGCSDALSPGVNAPSGPRGVQLDAVASQGTGGVGAAGTSIAGRFGKNPHVGDAIVATFFWFGSTNIVQSVTDRLSGGAAVGNTYNLVDYVTSGGISMATYVATNTQNYPDTSSDPSGSNLLVVQANLSSSITDGGIMISAYSGIEPTFAQALGAFHSASGSGSSATVADPGAIAVAAGGLAYGVTLSDGVANLTPPGPPFTSVATVSDANMKGDGEYAVPASAGSVDPHWTWNFTSQHTWLATALALTPTSGSGPGNLTVTTSTTGSNIDPDGYTVAVDGGSGQPIGTNASVTFTNLAAGSHSVALSGVASNCSVTGGNPRTVTVPSGGTATTTFTVGCSAPSGTGIVLDKWIGTFSNEDGRQIIKGFNPTNPQLGDAIVATFYWVGSTNVIDSVTDVLTTNPYTRVGNTFHLVEYRTAGGLSMATYVATNIQNFPGGATDSTGSRIYAVRANLADSVHGGLSLSAFSGAALDYTQALGGHQSASGSAATQTTADAGPLSVASGALVYGTVLVGGQGFAGMNPPAGFTTLPQQSDSPLRMVGDAAYAVQGAAGSSDPQWSVFLNAQDTWLASVLALNSGTGSSNQPPTAAFTSSCSALACGFTSTSSDPDGTIASYSWTFGDGGTSAAQNPSHTYGASGTYTVTLQVTDNQGATNSVSHTVTVNAANQPPVAAFTSSCSTLTCSFTSTSSDPDGTIASYSWTFGDGGTSTAQNPSHSYGAGGTYTVTLQVTDNQGATNSVSHTVTVTAANQPPTANFTFSCSALSCNFTSTSSDPDGSVVSYSWTFGDGGTSTAQNPSHSYGAAGSYTVTLRVTDNQGAVSSPTSKTVTVTAPNQPPTANFTVSCSALSCNFTSTSSDPDGTIASYSWTFGDGGTSTAQNPSHSYGAAGSYTVTLRVTDNQGAVSSPTSKTVTVTAPNQPPVASFTKSCSGLTCNFTSTSSDPDGSIASYSWTFGDGGTSTAQNPSHTYGAGGTYTVGLTVTDNQGATNSTSQSVTVTAPNSPPVVNAGPDETAVTGVLYSSTFSFSDANNNGPWSYTINWGDGSTSTGTNTSQGSFTVGHTYVVIMPQSFTVTVTVTDAAGASGSDSKVVSVLLL